MYKSQRINFMKRGHNMFGIVNEMQKNLKITHTKDNWHSHVTHQHQINCILKLFGKEFTRNSYKETRLTAAWLAQLGEHRSANQALTFCGLDTSWYQTHSFRIGAAS